MSFPIGAILGALGALAASPDGARAKANVVGGRYLLELPNQAVTPNVGVAVILGLQGFFAGLLVLSDAQAADRVLDPIAIVSFLLGLLIALFALSSGRFIAFDTRGIYLLSPWRRGPKTILFRDVVSIRKSLFRKLYVVRTASRQKARIRGDLHGFATLARLLLDHLPEQTRMNARTRGALTRLAQLDRL